MIDIRTLAIAVLTITATILLVGLVVINTLPTQQAFGYGQMDRAGDYVVATGQLQDSTELVYITDAAVGRMAVYMYDYSRKQLRLLDGFDLRRGLRGRQQLLR